MQNLITLPEEKGLETEKYEQSGMIAGKLIQGFYDTINALLPTTELFEVGCGEGFSAQYLKGNWTGIDIDADMVIAAKERNPDKNVYWGDVYTLEPVPKGTTVLCLEVLEHLERPDEALRELARITDEYAVISVPNEPLWHILNLARGKYLKDWGNGPGHINHWAPKSFRSLCEKYFDVVEMKLPVPWIICLLKKREE